jgi:hypothetical protein
MDLSSIVGNYYILWYFTKYRNFCLIIRK